MQRQRVLITGGTGFIGGCLAQRLRERGDRVRIFGRPGPKSEVRRQQGYDVVTGDLRRRDDVDAAVRGCDAVIHLGGAYRVEGIPLRAFRDINVAGTRHVLDAGDRHGVRRLVHVSTVGVYGCLQEIPADETHPCGWVDHYQRTKLAGETLARDAFADRLRGVGVIVRPTGAYGPGDLRFLKLFRAVRGRYFALPGRCRCRYHPTYIDDLRDGLTLALDRADAAGPYNIAGPRHLELIEYFRLLATVLGVPASRVRVPLLPMKAAAFVCEKTCRAVRVEPPLFRRRLGFFYNDRAYSIERAQRELGYDPQIGVEEGLRRTADWYRAQRLLR